jgi:hypothetical protein
VKELPVLFAPALSPISLRRRKRSAVGHRLMPGIPKKVISFLSSNPRTMNFAIYRQRKKTLDIDFYFIILFIRISRTKKTKNGGANMDLSVKLKIGR